MDKIEFIAKIALTGTVTEEMLESYLEGALDQLSDDLTATGSGWSDLYEVTVTKKGRDDGDSTSSSS